VCVCADNFHNILEEYGGHLTLIKKLRFKFILEVVVCVM